MSFFSAVCGLFRSDKRSTVAEEVAPELPATGEFWRLKDGSPWPTRFDPVEILDAKDGWVQYKMGALFPDERKTVGDFVRMYGRVDGGEV